MSRGWIAQCYAYIVSGGQSLCCERGVGDCNRAICFDLLQIIRGVDEITDFMLTTQNDVSYKLHLAAFRIMSVVGLKWLSLY